MIAVNDKLAKIYQIHAVFVKGKVQDMAESGSFGSGSAEEHATGRRKRAVTALAG
jgi:hypothetical protein